MVLQHLVPADLNLKTCLIILVSRCPCMSHEESVLQSLLTGPLASEVWSHCRRRFGILNIMSSSTSAMVLSWFYSASFVSTDHIRAALQAIILWFLWKARNIAQFEF